MAPRLPNEAIRSRSKNGIYPRQSTTKVRVSHKNAMQPVLARRISASTDWKREIEWYAFPKDIVPGTILERLVVKRVFDRGFPWQFQYVVDLPQLDTARVDVAVFGTGIGERFLALEPDGAIWHVDKEADEIRVLQLKAAGVAHVRLWEGDLLKSRERMEYVIDQALLGNQMPEPAGNRAVRNPWGEK